MECETRDLGVMWPHWHTLILQGDRNIDIRCVSPKDLKKMPMQQAGKHEFEELKEGASWLEPALALLRKKTKRDWTEKQRNVARKLVLEGGWVQQRLFDIGCRMKVNVKLATEKKAQKSTGSTIARMARDEGFQRRSESGSKKPKLQRKSGSGKEVSSRTLSVKANGTEGMQKWESEKQKAGTCQQRATRVMLLLTAPCWVPLASGEHVVGQWYSWTAMKMGPLHGMYGSMEAEFEVLPHHQEVGADGLSMLCQENDWTHQGAGRQQRNH